MRKYRVVPPSFTGNEAQTTQGDEMATYKCTQIAGENPIQFFVEANDYATAAIIALKQMKAHKNAVPIRVTGEFEKSGLFQGYYGSKCKSSAGYQFRVTEI